MRNRIFIFLFLFSSQLVLAQSPNRINAGGGTISKGNGFFDELGRDSTRILHTAVPFLTISPDSRSGGMGDVGAAISPDANAIHWNPAKLAFIDKDMGFAVSYTPWLRKLVNDMSLSQLSAFKKRGKNEAFGVALKYFDLGTLQFTDNNGNSLGDFKPKEFSIGGTYSRKLSQNFSVAVGLKYIHSRLANSIAALSNGNGSDIKPGNSAAVDFGVFYKKDVLFQGRNTNVAFGLNISDVGKKITYTNQDQQMFIPSNLRLGTAITTELDPYNKITFALDANKLLVPSTPVYYPNYNFTGDSIDNNGNHVILRGKDPNRPLLSGIFGSFSDAPDGLKEELREITISTGLEYWYNDLFAARCGFFHENKYKGNRQYLTIGIGVRYQVFGFDASYLVPFNLSNPLAETLRFTLHFNFEEKEKQTSIQE